MCEWFGDGTILLRNYWISVDGPVAATVSTDGSVSPSRPVVRSCCGLSTSAACSCIAAWMAERPPAPCRSATAAIAARFWISVPPHGATRQRPCERLIHASSSSSPRRAAGELNRPRNFLKDRQGGFGCRGWLFSGPGCPCQAWGTWNCRWIEDDLCAGRFEA